MVNTWMLGQVLGCDNNLLMAYLQLQRFGIRVAELDVLGEDLTEDGVVCAFMVLCNMQTKELHGLWQGEQVNDAGDGQVANSCLFPSVLLEAKAASSHCPMSWRQQVILTAFLSDIRLMHVNSSPNFWQCIAAGAGSKGNVSAISAIMQAVCILQVMAFRLLQTYPALPWECYKQHVVLDAGLPQRKGLAEAHLLMHAFEAQLAKLTGRPIPIAPSQALLQMLEDKVTGAATQVSTSLLSPAQPLTAALEMATSAAQRAPSALAAPTMQPTSAMPDPFQVSKLRRFCLALLIVARCSNPHQSRAVTFCLSFWQSLHEVTRA